MEENTAVNLANFTTGNFDKGASLLRRAAWFLVNALLVRASWNPFMGIKVILLRAFGAKIGRGLIIKSGVHVKFPWKLHIGHHCWLGENAWIDNLDTVTIGNNVCISQGAMLLTGNHDYTDISFPYRNAPITIDDGAWIGARAIVCPGVRVGTHAVLTVGALATHDLPPGGVYSGNPARKVRDRHLH